MLLFTVEGVFGEPGRSPGGGGGCFSGARGGGAGGQAERGEEGAGGKLGSKGTACACYFRA